MPAWSSTVSRRLVIGAVALLPLLAACTAPQRGVDLSVLDVGPHSRVPLDVPANDDPRYGRIIESVRMGEAIADPADADPALVYDNGVFSIRALPEPADAVSVLADAVRPVLERHGMVAGFMVGATDTETEDAVLPGQARVLTVVLLRFPDDEAARAAATEIDAADAAVSADNTPVTLATRPLARAHWRPGIPSLAATEALGPFVVSVLVGHTAPDIEAMTGLADSALTAQRLTLTGFEPTPLSQIPTLPLDTDGMLRRTVPTVPGEWPYPSVEVLDNGPNADWDDGAAFEGVVLGERATYFWRGRGGPDKDTTIDRLTSGDLTSVWRFRDRELARTGFGNAADALRADQRRTPVDGPAGVPDAACGDLTEITNVYQEATRVYCVVRHDRYMAAIFGRTADEARQRAAAQYALLVVTE
ncbi:hypothetical protein ACFXK0_18695 [Nocardia sp. NPDC059177]|uniref:DUF7373 family lipoprotein n=1 Tax=Nocardia sp. NPDC059177 TaxID=3346759 RepID=UPI003689FEF6